MKYKAITFVNGTDILHGHYFYDVTWEQALAKMLAKGINPITNFKMTISYYYW